MQTKGGKHEYRNTAAMYCCCTARMCIRNEDTECTIRCYYISALVLTSFHLAYGHSIIFRFERIVASLLHLMVLFFKVIFNHTPKQSQNRGAPFSN